MSVDDQYRSIVARLRSPRFNVQVEEIDGCYGANNGIANWNNGIPDGSLKHHFVCSLNPARSYIYSLVMMLKNGYGDLPGPVVNWFGDVNGKAWLIATRPANHSGKGNSSVLRRIRSGQAPLGPAVTYAPGNDYTGNAYWSGQELQHPGDSTPWPTALLRGAIAVSAAECIEFGHTANAVLNHYEHTDRKQDMSYQGGPASTSGATWFRGQVAAWIAAKGDPAISPVPRPSGPPAFPLPAGYYYGPLSGPAQSVSGMFRTDTQVQKDGLKLAQMRLNHNGNNLTVTGQYDNPTAAALKRFQIARGLPADGLIRPDTWKALWT